MTTEEVLLAVPALPEYVRLVRLAAAGLATRLGFSFDEVEDLRIAVDELCYLLVGHDGGPGSMTMRFELHDDALVIRGEGEAGSRRHELSELSERILEAIADEYTVARAEDGTITFRMVQRRDGG